MAMRKAGSSPLNSFKEMSTGHSELIPYSRPLDDSDSEGYGPSLSGDTTCDTIAPNPGDSHHSPPTATSPFMWSILIVGFRYPHLLFS